MAEFPPYEWITTHYSSNHNNKIVPNPTNQPIQSESEKLHSLKHLIGQNQDLGTACSNDTFLLKFLRAKKFNLPGTFTLLQNYYWHRRKYWEVFENFTIDADDVMKSLRNGLPGVLSSKDRKGRCVLLFQATNWHQNEYDLQTIYRCLLLTLHFLLNDVHNQHCGFVIIVDWTEFTFRQCSGLKPWILRMFIEGLQDAFPLRIKGVHFIQPPWYMNTIITLIKTSLLNEKIQKRIFVHGNNLSTLHAMVHKDILPTDLGGEQPVYNPEMWAEFLQNTDKTKFQL